MAGRRPNRGDPDMKTVLVTLAPGFEEIETITVVDILRRAGARVTLGATQYGPIEGSRGVSVLPDTTLDRLGEQETFDLIVLPGGQPGTDNLCKNTAVHSLLQEQAEAGRAIAAICAAPMVLDQAGLLEGRCVTSHPSVADRLNSGHYVESRVAVDGNLITSRAPGTALEFALALVDKLFGPERMEMVNKGVLARI